ncbi:putative lipopolysaccharide biosynthesis O-acetyl transferase WbbJ [Vibrio chagasii]|nr:putative lipopolysaccharide biosynthesis O-acetyl transferase WbbJ [Vibrio chagasii]CAH7427501.1 putative lipopolysaccharide biosynthesis O-acetyl transferase WbbJ [Vibrio chagasii]
MKGYNLYSIFNLIMSKIYTILFHRNARLVRLPVVIRGSENICFGRGFTTGRYCRIDALSEHKNQIVFGSNCQINDSVHMAAIENITIGDNVLIASRVFITDHNHGNYSGTTQDEPGTIVSKRSLKGGRVKIGDNVWLGEGVVVLPNVSIGDNVIVGANSVVTKDVPGNSIICGSPARIIKKYDDSLNKWVPCN